MYLENVSHVFKSYNVFLKLLNIYENYCLIILNSRNVSKHVNRVCRMLSRILHSNFLILDEHILEHVEPDEFRKHIIDFEYM